MAENICHNPECGCMCCGLFEFVCVECLSVTDVEVAASDSWVCPIRTASFGDTELTHYIECLAWSYETYCTATLIVAV